MKSRSSELGYLSREHRVGQQGVRVLDPRVFGTEDSEQDRVGVPEQCLRTLSLATVEQQAGERDLGHARLVMVGALDPRMGRQGALVGGQGPVEVALLGEHRGQRTQRRSDVWVLRTEHLKCDVQATFEVTARPVEVALRSEDDRELMQRHRHFWVNIGPQNSCINLESTFDLAACAIDVALLTQNRRELVK